MPLETNTGVGRIVWGNPAKGQTKKDQKTKVPVMRDGLEVTEWKCGIAFPKAEFEQMVYPFMQQEAMTLFPNGVPGNFSWKIKDGDGVDAGGKPYADRDGYAGCWILTVGTESFAPNIFKREGNGFRQMEAHEIKCGDFVAVCLNLKANKPTNSQHTPGLYVNPKGFEFVGYGQEILGAGANPDEMFAGQTYAMPVGASATPVASSNGAVAPNMGMAQQPAPAQQYAAPAPAQQYAAPALAQPNPAMPQATPQMVSQQQPGQTPPVTHAGQPPAVAPNYPAPAHDFVNNAGQPPAHDFVNNAGQPPAVTPAPAPMNVGGNMPAPQPVAMSGLPQQR